MVTLNSPQQRHLTASPSWTTWAQWWRKCSFSCGATSPVWLLPSASLFGGTKETKLSSQLEKVGKVVYLFGPQHVDICPKRFWRKNYFYLISARARLPKWERHWLWCETDPDAIECVVHHHRCSGQKWQWNNVLVWGSVGPRSRRAPASSEHGVQPCQHHRPLWVPISAQFYNRCVFSLCIYVFFNPSVITSQQINPPSIPRSSQR